MATIVPVRLVFLTRHATARFGRHVMRAISGEVTDDLHQHLGIMRAAVFEEPFVVATTTKPVPAIALPTDVLVKVRYSGLCGSDLHYYRGHIPLKNGTTMGHEFVGVVAAKGDDVTEFDVGDEVISTFTIQCGHCWYCQHGLSGTCDKTNTFGKPGLEGAQAEYVLVPYAKSTLVKKPPTTPGVDDSVYVLMADIFVTGYFGVKKIIDHFDKTLGPQDMRVLQMGAGPVGICAVRVLRHFGFTNIVVVDALQDRLEVALKMGATEVVNFKTQPDRLAELKEHFTEGVGFDAVLEIVGATSAMKTAFDSLRRGGFISSVGMGHEALPFNALEAYVKGLTVSFGRCNAWSLFEEALEVFEVVKGDFQDFIEATPLIEEAAEYYKMFERGEVKKVVFKFE